MIMGVLCLLMLIAGYFGGKIIVLEQIAIVQITWISLLTVYQPVVTFEALKFLKLSFDYTFICLALTETILLLIDLNNNFCPK